MLSCGWVVAAAGCGTSPAGPPDAGPAALDQCTNPADLAIIADLASTIDGGIPDGGVPDGGPYPLSYIAAVGYAFDACNRGPCLSNILAETDVDACLDACLGTSPASEISAGCRSCTVELIGCSGTYCITECLGADQSLCESCALMYCVPRYSACTGLPAPGIP